MADTMEKLREIFFSGSGIKIKNSSMHLIMPSIVIFILLLLTLIMLISRIVKCARTKTPFINLKGYQFFAKGFDPVVFFGTIGILIVYFIIMPKLHFVFSSILALFALNMLYSPPLSKENGVITVKWKTVLICGIISVVGPILVWVFFGLMFGLTLP